MKVLLSPAKSLNENCTIPSVEKSTPVFIENADYLSKKMAKLSVKKIKSLMSLSDDLANLNYNRFQNWDNQDTESNKKPALFYFSGDVYRGLNAQSFNDNEVRFAQNTVRILSGIYGLLKPMDFIKPYRLEMGTRFAVTPKTKNLYSYWGSKIAEQLNSEESELIVNLASGEYFKAVDTKALKPELVTCNFKDNKNGEYKTIMTFAKLARGFMTRFIVNNDITKKEDLKAFDLEGYIFNTNLSSDSEFVFTRG